MRRGAEYQPQFETDRRAEGASFLRPLEDGAIGKLATDQPAYKTTERAEPRERLRRSQPGAVGFSVSQVPIGMKELRCQAPSGPAGRRCDAELGEASRELRLIGVFTRWESQEENSGAREVKHCSSCGWYNLFEAASQNDRKSRRARSDAEP